MKIISLSLPNQNEDIFIAVPIFHLMTVIKQ